MNIKEDHSMTAKTELEPVMETTIEEYSQTAAALAELSERYAGVTFDVTTKAGLTEAKAAKAELRNYRTDLERERVRIKAPALQRTREIDSEAKRITLALRALEDPIAKQIQAEADRAKAEREAKIRVEEERVEAIQQQLAWIRGHVTAAALPNVTRQNVAQSITDIEALDFDFEEFAVEAAEAKTAALAQLRDMIDVITQREADEAELAKLREEQAARDREAAEERERIEAKERAQAAEQKRLDDEREAFEQEKRDAAAAKEREAREQAEAIERAKEAREQLEAEAAERAKFPGTRDIQEAVIDAYMVERDVVEAWFDKMGAADLPSERA